IEGRPRGLRPAPFRAPPHLLATSSGNRSCRLGPDLIPRMLPLSARAASGCGRRWVASLPRDLIPRMFHLDPPAETTAEVSRPPRRPPRSPVTSRRPGQPGGGSENGESHAQARLPAGFAKKRERRLPFGAVANPETRKIVALLGSEAHERQIAAAIVLGEIGARDAAALDALV